MNSELNIHKQLFEAFLVAVIRGKTKEETIDLAQQAIVDGVKAIEITMTSPEAISIIALLKLRHPDLLIGAGTVLDVTTCAACMQAGADFIVSPGISMALAQMMQKHKGMYLPGVMTPTDIMLGLEHGFTHFKLFPASGFSPHYLKTLKGPFPDVKFMPTGGINLNNFTSWQLDNVFAIGVGSELFKQATQSVHDQVSSSVKEYLKRINQRK